MKRNCSKLLSSLIVGCCSLGLASCGSTAKVKVTFNANGGVGDVKVIEIDKGSVIPTAEVPTNYEKEGYLQDGWRTGEGTSGEVFTIASTKIESDITLYANWDSDAVEVTFGDVVEQMWAQKAVKATVKNDNTSKFVISQEKEKTDEKGQTVKYWDPTSFNHYLAGEIIATVNEYSYTEKDSSGKDVEVKYNAYDADYHFATAEIPAEPKEGEEPTKPVYEYKTIEYLRDSVTYDYADWHSNWAETYTEGGLPTEEALKKWSSEQETSLANHAGKSSSVYGVFTQEVLETAVDVVVKVLGNDITFTAHKQKDGSVKADIDLIEVVKKIVDKVMDFASATKKSTTVDSMITDLGITEASLNTALKNVTADEIYNRLLASKGFVHILQDKLNLEKVPANFGELCDTLIALLQKMSGGKTNDDDTAILANVGAKLLSDISAKYFYDKYKGVSTELGTIIWTALDTLNGMDVEYIASAGYSIIDKIGFELLDLIEEKTKIVTNPYSEAQVGCWSTLMNEAIKLIYKASTILNDSAQSAHLKLTMDDKYLLSSAQLNIDVQADVSKLVPNANLKYRVEGVLNVTFDYPSSVTMISRDTLENTSAAGNKNSASKGDDVIEALPVPAETVVVPAEAVAEEATDVPWEEKPAEDSNYDEILYDAVEEAVEEESEENVGDEPTGLLIPGEVAVPVPFYGTAAASYAQ